MGTVGEKTKVLRVCACVLEMDFVVGRARELGCVGAGAGAGGDGCIEYATAFHRVQSHGDAVEGIWLVGV